jgi:hypothetical protein
MKPILVAREKRDQLMAPKIPKGFRLPEDAPPEVRELADHFLQKIVDVADGKVHSRKAGSVLKAAVEGRKELCGPIAQKVDVDVRGRLEMLLSEGLEPAPDVSVGGAQDAPPTPTPED